MSAGGRTHNKNTPPYEIDYGTGGGGSVLLDSPQSRRRARGQPRNGLRKFEWLDDVAGNKRRKRS